MFSPVIHRYIYLFGTCGLAFGMMVGTVPTSVPQFILLGNWLLEADFKRKWSELRYNKLFWILSAAFLIHVLGLLHTQDLKAGWDDVRTKIPMMFLPMIFLSTPIFSAKEFRLVLFCFLLGSVVNTAWCYIYTFILHQNEVVRSASRFMSHIRLGLYLNIAIACSLYFITQYRSLWKRCGLCVLILYFLFSMYALGLASGIFNFFILSVLVLAYFALQQGLLIKLLVMAGLVAASYAVCSYVYKVYESQVTVRPTPNNYKMKTAASGRPYFHFDEPTQRENGNYVQINIQLEELQREWKRRCPEDSFIYQPAHNLDRYQVLIRYLSSKGLNKDSAAVWSLTEDDIANIRNNLTNYELPEWSYLHKRVYELVNEYDEYSNNRNVSGHSISMRLYFWKAAWHVAGKNLLTGVGSGDVQSELNKAYRELKAPLSEEWYKRPHNQFLTVWVALGIIGLAIFVISIFYAAFALRSHLHILYWPFFILAVLSFFAEDTLETQAGQTFFAFFNALFVAMAAARAREEKLAAVNEVSPS